ncbi:unnamed protein product [Diatraea saccharalis]|uniref:Uncharacterized protein n=1 Tax=Diatraea saccharalis TaxID=40085 RepID=A0A9N9WKX4_9NEOP|nr:unnamed protein product [Diatraea saccharalis]
MAKEDVIMSESTSLYKHLLDEVKASAQEPQSAKITHDSGDMYFAPPSLMRSKMDIELQIAGLRRHQLLMDKKIVEEVFRAKENALEAETKLALTMLEAYPTPGSPLTDSVGVNTNAINVFSNASAPPATSFEQDPVKFNTSAQNEISSPSRSDSAIGTPGLSALSSLDRVKVRLVSSPGLNETYEVLGSDESVIFHVKISLKHPKGDKNLSFEGEILDKHHEEVVKFHLNENRELVVTARNEKVCSIKRQPTLIKPVLTVNDNDNKVLFKVKGQGLRSNIPIFPITNLEKVPIGGINKALPLTAQPSNFVDAQLSSIDFPRDLDVKSKAAIIACNFIIVSTDHAMIRSRLLQNELLMVATDKNVTEY